MKKGALIFNVVLSVAVLVLFYLHFNGNKSNMPIRKNNQIPVSSDSKILYIDQDSLNAGYNFFAELEQKFTLDNQVRQEKLQNMQRNLESMLKNYEKNVMTMTTRERQKEEERIGQYQQNFQNEAQQFQQLAAMQEAQMITQIYDTLSVFFKEYAALKGCDMIFTYQKGGQIMYISPALDVTAEVIQQLNQRHAKNSKNTSNTGTQPLMTPGNE